MKRFVFLVVMLLSADAWALDSLGRWVADIYFYNIEDAVGGFKAASPTQNGNLREMKVYLEVITQPHDVKCAMYSWPDTVLIDSTQIVECAVGTAWHTFKFIDSAMIYSESSYALVAWADGTAGNCNIGFSSAGDDWIFDIIKAYGVWPDTFKTFDNTNATPCNIYATYEPTAAGAAGQVIMIQTGP